ncbi:ATP synthase F1 subunit epsilon [Clostridium sp. AM58-1XD]|uniref:ATP synthase F1 subunit epsilon n=1 Tax=Clostridium sp. AM58-1XD TaxID=2292307 RepID=UPI000E527927|nr:ATP synthase F1 subunit epsilon [Clostridium sp. AM58-1XD]RGZ01174.1 ATP synthase F1 subunit epsilon [Clostridium sp. AM58-1XD]
MDKNTFGLNIIASDRDFYHGRAVSIVLPALDGEYAILAHHADTMVAMIPGEMRFTTENGEQNTVVVSSGFAQIINNRVTVLVASVEKPEEIDIRRAREAEERAKEQLRQKQSMQEYYVSKASLARAMSRLKATQKYNQG